MQPYNHRLLIRSLFLKEPPVASSRFRIRGTVDRQDYDRIFKRIRFGPNDPPLYTMTVRQRMRFLRTYARLERRFASVYRDFYITPDFRPILSRSQSRRSAERAEARRSTAFKRKLKLLKGVMTEREFIPSDKYKTFRQYYQGTLNERVKKQFLVAKRRRMIARRSLQLTELIIGSFTRRGKKIMAFRFLREVIRKISSSRYYKNNKLKLKSPLAVIFKAVAMAKPLITLKTKRVGGVIYRLPVIVRGFRRSSSMGVRFMFQAAQSRSGKLISTRFAREVLDIHRRRGGSFRHKEELYRTGVGNKAFMHYLFRKKRKFKGILNRIRP